MRFLIDGYNLLFRLSTVLQDFTASREQVIHDLNRKAARLHMNLTIVFDAHERPGEAYRTHYDHMEILYSGEKETADDLILKVLRNNAANSTVVTSDNLLAWKARMLGAKTESVDAFLIQINKRYLNAAKKVKSPPPPTVKAQGDYLAAFEVEEKKEPKKKGESDFDRWLRIFEEKLKKFGA